MPGFQVALAWRTLCFRRARQAFSARLIVVLELSIEQQLLDLADRSSDVDAPRARFHAVENRAAAPHALGCVEDFQPLLRPFIPAVENEAVGIYDRRRSDVIGVCPE